MQLPKWRENLSDKTPSQKLTTASVTNRLASLGSERWAVHFDARRRVAAGEDIIELTIGEPDVPTPDHLIEVAYAAMRAGRTRYSGGRGETAFVNAVAGKYAKRSGRDIGPKNVMSLPGTQAALAVAMKSLVEAGDGVLVPDPYYATYEGVVGASGAEFIPVPMAVDNGFHLTAEQLRNAITPNSKVLLLNSPHNPTGAVLSADEIAAIGEVCIEHNLWIVSDEVYEQLIYKGEFASPFDMPQLADRTISVASISKSHAAPGFRAGWAAGPEWVMDRLQSVSEALFFGGPPFIADMAAHALTNPDNTADTMSGMYQNRITLLKDIFAKSNTLTPLLPEAGMFMLLDVSATGKSGEEFCTQLLEEKSVATMPGSAFGVQAENFIRLSLTVADDKLTDAAQRIVDLASN